MARLELFTVAEEASVDQTTNRLSIFGVLEIFETPSVPVLVYKCCAVAVWQREAEDEGRDFQSIVRVNVPGGETHQVETNFQMTHARHRIVNRIQGLLIPKAGDVVFELLLNGQHSASHVFTVQAQQNQDLQPANP